MTISIVFLFGMMKMFKIDCGYGCTTLQIEKSLNCTIKIGELYDMIIS